MGKREYVVEDWNGGVVRWLMEQRCEKVHCFHIFTSDSLHITAPG